VDRKTLLQPAEGRLLGLVRNHLAVEQKAARPLSRQRGTNLRVKCR
jgi:hypothetical protein